MRHRRPRIPALDGLRGVAAMVVVFSHVLVATLPELADGIVHPGLASTGLVAYILLYTPVHIIWAGQEFVIVFFVLSGFVLSLPVARGEGFKPLSYYPQRLVRLYVPVWGALCLAWVAHSSVEGRTGTTWWLTTQASPISHDAVVQSILLNAGSFPMLLVLWSLHWEVVFSLLLPLFLVVATVTRRTIWLGVAIAGAFLLIGTDHPWAFYLPSFLVGTLMAYHHPAIEALARRLALGSWRTTVAKVGLLAACGLGLTADWWLRLGHWFLTAHDEDVARRLAKVMITGGAACAVLLPLLVTRVREVLESRPIHHVGTRSYSLYLVHEPVVALVAFAFARSAGTLAVFVIAVPAALLLSEVFYRGVERPALAVARRVGTLGRRASAA